MAAWFGKKNENDENQQKMSEDKEQSANEETQRIVITETAKEKLNQLIHGAESPVLGIRIIAEAASPMNPEYQLAFVQQGEDFEDDTVLELDGLKVYIDADSLEYIENVKLDFITSGAGGGFRIDKIVETSTVEGPLAEKLQQIINEQINPALALHGGFISLIDVKDSTAFIELGGGCKGCGMVDVTLKQGIEVMIKQNLPEITEILDTTDHASGRNPYYQPSK